MVGRLLSFWEGLCLEAKPLVLGIIAVECHLFVVKGRPEMLEVAWIVFLGNFVILSIIVHHPLPHLDGVLKYFAFAHQYLRKIPILTNHFLSTPSTTLNHRLHHQIWGQIFLATCSNVIMARWKHLVKSSKRPWQFDIACIFHRVNYSGLHHVKETQK